jgi:hypothetical protein
VSLGGCYGDRHVGWTGALANKAGDDRDVYRAIFMVANPSQGHVEMHCSVYVHTRGKCRNVTRAMRFVRV